MLGLTDLLKLHVQKETEKFLKPWWDVVTDYLTLVLVMTAVVTAVVGLYAQGPICMAAVRCPPRGNSSLHKHEICTQIHDPSRYQEYPSDFHATVAIRLDDRDLLAFVNTECRQQIQNEVRFFPNVLVILAGVCLVCSNAWFVLKSSVLEQFCALLDDCYKLNRTPSTEEEGIKYTKAKVKKFVEEFSANDNTGCECCSSYYRMKRAYILVLLVQIFFVLGSIIFLSVIEQTISKSERFACNINEIISGIVYDHFLCAYTISTFYFFAAVAFLSIFCVDLFFSILKLHKLASALNGNIFRIENRTVAVEPKDLAFLLKLVQNSTYAYLYPFLKLHQDLKLAFDDHTASRIGSARLYDYEFFI